MKPERAIQDEQQKLPATLSLMRSQALSLTALNNDEQRLRKQAQDVNVLLEATIKARAEVVEEISKAHEMSAEDIRNNYRFDGEKLFRIEE